MCEVGLVCFQWHNIRIGFCENRLDNLVLKLSPCSKCKLFLFG